MKFAQKLHFGTGAFEAQGIAGAGNGEKWKAETSLEKRNRASREAGPEPYCLEDWMKRSFVSCKY